MGRYYNGDIEGKFWFGVQSSDDADFFGQQGQEPSQLNYYFDEDDLPDVNKGIDKCISYLGEMRNKLDQYFKAKDCYNDKELAKHFKITERQVSKYLEWYARLQLGEQIRDCINKIGHCEFEAEL
jgi:hypothetical protein